METGRAVVFSNWIPHRFLKISNPTTTVQRRTFLNFFIVDPSMPITSTKHVLTAEFLADILIKASIRQGFQLPSDVIRRILSHLNIWTSLKEAQDFRDKSRAAMQAQRSGWGWIHYGNCGTQQFVANLEASPLRDRLDRSPVHSDD